MKLKFLIVLFLLLAEMAYAGKMIVESNDPEVLEKVLTVPVLGEWVYEQRISEVRSRAESGDIYSMMALFSRSEQLGNAPDQELAHKLLWNSGSPTAQLFLFQKDGGDSEKMKTREFMLLEARAMKENIRPFLLKGDPNHAYTQQTRRYAGALDALRAKAEAGDKDAKWVLDNLEPAER